MRNTPSLQALPGSLWLGVVASINGSNRTKLRTYAKLNYSKKSCFGYLNCVLMLK